MGGKRRAGRVWHLPCVWTDKSIFFPPIVDFFPDYLRQAFLNTCGRERGGGAGSVLALRCRCRCWSHTPLEIWERSGSAADTWFPSRVCTFVRILFSSVYSSVASVFVVCAVTLCSPGCAFRLSCMIRRVHVGLAGLLCCCKREQPGSHAFCGGWFRPFHEFPGN